MATQFWTKKQDPACAQQIKELGDKLDSLGRVVDELAAENGRLKEEMANRAKVTDDDLSAMESRLTTRIEEMEDRAAQGADYSVNEEDSPVSGYVKPSVRKRKIAEAHSDPTVWTKPRPVRQKPAEAPEK